MLFKNIVVVNSNTIEDQLPLDLRTELNRAGYVLMIWPTPQRKPSMLIREYP